MADRTKDPLVPKRITGPTRQKTQAGRIDSKAKLKIMEENNIRLNGSDKISTRKALADVSNIQRPLSKKDGGITKKEKHDSFMHPRRIPVGPNVKTSITRTRKSLVKTKTDVTEGIGQNNKITGASTKPMLRSYSRNYGSDYRATAKNVKVRNSLPVSRIISEATERLSKNKCHNVGDVGEKVNKRTQGQLNPVTCRLLNRRSEGFLVRGSANVNMKEVSNKVARRPIKPIVKKPVRLSDTWRPTLASNSKKLSLAEKPFMKKDVRKAKSLAPSEKALSVVICDKSSLTTTASNTIVRGKSCRRRSFTSLIMRGPKLIDKQVKCEKEDELVAIDDTHNHLEVSEYVDDIYQYYWVTEAHCPCLAGYMNIHADISSRMRAILVNWLIEVHFKFDLMQETLYLTVTLLDRYLSMVPITKNELQLVGLTALLLASKYEDFWHPKIEELISISVQSYTRGQFLGMEKLILNRLSFRFNLPTPYVFMLRFLKAALSDKKLEHLSFYLIELCLVEYDALKFKPSLLSASAIYVARSILQITPPWTPLLRRHARYDEDELRDCAEMIQRVHKAAKKGSMDVTYKKYSSRQFGCVAAI